MLNAFKLHQKPMPVCMTKVQKVAQGPIDSLPFGTDANEAHIFWYIGSHGFKKDAVSFYQPHIKARIEAQKKVYLYDMTAWGAFSSSAVSLDKANKNTDIESEFLKFIPSSKVFAFIRSMDNNPELEKLAEEICEIPELFDVSKGFIDSGITVADVFKDVPRCLEKISDMDVAKTYSVFQYLELFAIIDEVLKDNMGKDFMTIRFNLPNDESKYYPDRMKRDVLRFVSAMHSDRKGVAVDIRLFTYGEAMHHRPYNAGNKVIKSHIKEEEITGIQAPSSKIKKK